MRILVTGAAGFIGSHIASSLIQNGNTVVGLDSLSSVLYPSSIKAARINELSKFKEFNFYHLNLATDKLDGIIGQIDAVINEAALPGQILSWDHFESYVQSNLTSVDRIIHFCLSRNVPKLIQASTSSVYGVNAVGGEGQAMRPASPYGVTKLAAESLLNAYQQNFPLNFSTVRYFSVYGPSQRPDMGIYKFIESISSKKPIKVFGDGLQRRDCTFVGDIVNGTISAMKNGRAGAVYNLAGGTNLTVLEIINLCGKIIGHEPIIEFVKRPVGDQLLTSGDYSMATSELSYSPQYSFEEGLRLQVAWQLK